MCGLNLTISQAENGFTAEQKAILATQICLTQFRGADSTGVVSVDNKGLWSSLKAVGGPSALFNTKEWDPWYEDVFQTGKIVFGHGRAATRGTVTLENAHPFIAKKSNGHEIVFVHNGTLDAWQTLPGFRDFAVDSEWLANAIAIHGIKETFGKVRGPIACIWWDTEFKTINVYRNADRPLYVVRNPKTKDVFANSELESLMYIKHKFDLPFESKDIQIFTPEKHYMMELEELHKVWVAEAIPVIHPPVKTYERHTPHYGNSSYGKWDKMTDQEVRDWWLNEGSKNKTIPREEWKNIPRGFDNDIKHIQEGTIIAVEWKSRTQFAGSYNRVTIMPQGEFVDEWCVPYKVDLARMARSPDDPRRVRMQYDDGRGTRWGHDVPSQMVLDAVPIGNKQEARTVDTIAQTPAIGGAPLMKGTKRTWKSPKIYKGGDKVKHRATISLTHERHLSEYYNPIDGMFEIGDVINMEPDTFIDRGPGRLEIRGGRLTATTPSKFVEFYCHVQRSRDEMERLPFIQGTIKMMKLCSTEEFSKAGHYVYILLDNVTDGAPDNEDETAVVVMDNPALPTEIGKVVH
jgi:hypothetical protein